MTKQRKGIKTGRPGWGRTEVTPVCTRVRWDSSQSNTNSSERSFSPFTPFPLPARCPHAAAPPPRPGGIRHPGRRSRPAPQRAPRTPAGPRHGPSAPARPSPPPLPAPARPSPPPLTAPARPSPPPLPIAPPARTSRSGAVPPPQTAPLSGPAMVRRRRVSPFSPLGGRPPAGRGRDRGRPGSLRGKRCGKRSRSAARAGAPPRGEGRPAATAPWQRGGARRGRGRRNQPSPTEAAPGSAGRRGAAGPGRAALFRRSRRSHLPRAPVLPRSRRRSREDGPVPVRGSAAGRAQGGGCCVAGGPAAAPSSARRAGPALWPGVLPLGSGGRAAPGFAARCQECAIG